MLFDKIQNIMFLELQSLKTFFTHTVCNRPFILQFQMTKPSLKCTENWFLILLMRCLIFLFYFQYVNAKFFMTYFISEFSSIYTRASQ